MADSGDSSRGDSAVRAALVAVQQQLRDVLDENDRIAESLEKMLWERDQLALLLEQERDNLREEQARTEQLRQTHLEQVQRLAEEQRSQLQLLENQLLELQKPQLQENQLLEIQKPQLRDVRQPVKELSQLRPLGPRRVVVPRSRRSWAGCLLSVVFVQLAVWLALLVGLLVWASLAASPVQVQWPPEQACLAGGGLLCEGAAGHSFSTS